MRCFDLINFLKDLFADKEERNYIAHVPQYCRQCELLGICRDKNNQWKCHHGCMVLNAGRKTYGEK